MSVDAPLASSFIHPGTQTLVFCFSFLGWIVPPQLNFSGNAPTDMLRDASLRCGKGMRNNPGFRTLLNVAVFSTTGVDDHLSDHLVCPITESLHMGPPTSFHLNPMVFSSLPVPHTERRANHRTTGTVPYFGKFIFWRFQSHLLPPAKIQSLNLFIPFQVIFFICQVPVVMCGACWMVLVCYFHSVLCPDTSQRCGHILK